MSISGAELFGQMVMHKLNQEAADVARLREIEAAARDLAAYEDFEEPHDCPHCSPQEPAAYNAARKRLHDALKA